MFIIFIYTNQFLTDWTKTLNNMMTNVNIQINGNEMLNTGLWKLSMADTTLPNI